MKLEDLQHGAVTSLELIPSEVKEFDVTPSFGAACSLVRHSDAGETLFGLYKPDRPGEIAQTWQVKGANRSAALRLDEIVGRDLPRLQYVLATSPRNATPTRVVLKVHEFTGHQAFSTPLEAGIDDKIQRELCKTFVQGFANAGQLDAYLRDQVLLPPDRTDGPPRALLCASPDRDLAGARAFRVLGRTLILDLLRNLEGKLVVARVHQARKPSPRDSRPLMLVEVDLRFPDISITGAYRGTARAALEQLAERNESYLGFWKGYNLLEKRSLARQARAFRWLCYTRCTQARTGAWRFELDPGGPGSPEGSRLQERIARLQEEGLSLEADDKLPPSLVQETRKADEAETAEARNLREAAEDEDLLEDLQAGRDHFLGTYEAHRHQGQHLVLELMPPDPDETFKPPARGFLFVSVRGDVVRLRRRAQAETAIRTAQNPLPQLCLLLEDQPTPVGRYKKLKEMSKAARARFRGDPTPSQLKALRVALNTPDIALIQGPPGTGKTQVITALEILLAEAGEQTDSLSGSILLSSFQHDAVENAAERTEVLGLPAVKVGKRQGQDSDLDPARTWRKTQIQRLKEMLLDRPDRPFEALRTEVSRLAALYRHTPGVPAQVINQLRFLASSLQGHVPVGLLDELVETALRLEQVSHPLLDTDPERQMLLRKAVKGLRFTREAFLDDGPRSALKLLSRFQDPGRLSPSQRALLEQAAAWHVDQPLEFLPDLETLHNALLDSLQPDERPPVTPVADPEIEALMARAVDALCATERTSRDGIDAALWTFLEDLENDPVATTEALREYTVVLAATCQQAVGGAMLTAKDVDGKDTSLAFESVLIDEAARANPLDLLIPMARASRRIILVGDHRQLPHMLEPDLERELETSASELTLKALRESLFQRLFERLEARHSAGDICRTVRLDTQFRMHPDLGDFISHHFYGDGLKSVRPATEFAHALPGYTRAGTRIPRIHVNPSGCMAWLEVPLTAGSEVGGRSKSRPPEARAIVRELKRLLEVCDQSADPVERNLTFGLITFYAAQVEQLWEDLTKEGLARYQDGRFRLERRYQRLENEHERVRVGTVDAFQGKEFDVVFLSMTRASTMPDGTELERRSRFGHLMLSNRVNVAMSRQHRLLVVVGASEMVKSPSAREAIPALQDFHRLCREDE